MEQLMHKYDKIYLQDTYKFETQTTLHKFEINEKDSNLYNLYFQDTVFHPQGGGQPSDEGFIIFEKDSEQIQIPVKSLEYNRGFETVVHKITKEDFENSGLKENSPVQLKINEEKRRLYARIHSGGHLLDVAVNRLKLDWQPGKGYHFEKGPYVEYYGELEADKIEELRKQLTEICSQVIQEKIQESKNVLVNQYKYSEAEKIMKIPEYIPQGTDFRYVRLFEGDEGCPCGGTHVQHVSEIERVIVTKIKVNKNKKTITVSYSVNPVEEKPQQQQQQKQKQKPKKEKQPKQQKKEQQTKQEE